MKRWNLTAPPVSEKVDALSNRLGISKLLAAMLVQRGLADEKAAEQFLAPEVSHLRTPFALDGMEAAVTRIQQACKRGEQVGIFGDYDADGIAGTALLVMALRELGLNVSYRLPNRLTEGYGLNRAGLQDLSRDGAELIITVDCGISSIADLQWAREKGLDVIICDHHLPAGALPPAAAILNPNISTDDPWLKNLCGAGVAFKLACALFDSIDPRWLELAALGTVADVVPLAGENRVIVTQGLKALGATGFAGIQALAKLAEVDLGSVNAGSIGFRLAPRLNAAGRLGSAVPAVELFLTEDKTTAYKIAQQLDQMNRKRQQLETDVLAEASSQIEQTADFESETALVAAGEDWHPGVIGIVASRLVDKWHRPVLVISLLEDIGKGSGRSIPNFSLYEVLKACSSHLTAFGGHRLAAGFSLEKKQLPFFRRAFAAAAISHLKPKDCVASLRVDSETSLKELNLSIVEELERLAPFGYGNPKPVFMLRDVKARAIRQIGAEGAHLRLTLSQDGQTLPAVGFWLGDKAEKLTAAKLDIIGQVAITEWKERIGLEFRLLDIRTADFPAEICCQPSDEAAPTIVDWRKIDQLLDDQEMAAVMPGYDLVLSKLPLGLAELRQQIVKVPPRGQICLCFSSDEVAAAGDEIEGKYPDRDFITRVYLLIKQAGSAGISALTIAEALSTYRPEEEVNHKVQVTLTILTELGLVEKTLRGNTLCFTVKRRKERVDLNESPTFKQLNQKAKMMAFFSQAPPAILAEALGRMWRECEG